MPSCAKFSFRDPVVRSGKATASATFECLFAFCLIIRREMFSNALRRRALLKYQRRAAAPRLFSSTNRNLKDPWTLPNTPEHEVKTRSPVDLPPPTPLPRHGEDVDTLRARLVYQSRKRGTLESDLLLSTFAQERLRSMSEEEMKEYDKVGPQFLYSL